MKDKIIISTSKFEKTTDLVLEYVDYLGGSFTRFHREDFLTDVTIELGPESEKDLISLKFSDKHISLSSTSRFWYRRGGFSFQFPFNESDVHQKLKKHINDEWEITKFFLHDYLST